MNNMSLGEKLTLLRNRKNLSKKDLGELAGIHAVTISKYEHNQMIPSLEAIAKLAKALNSSTDYLILDKELYNISDKELLDLTEKADNLSEVDKARIKNLIKSYVE